MLGVKYTPWSSNQYWLAGSLDTSLVFPDLKLLGQIPFIVPRQPTISDEDLRSLHLYLTQGKPENAISQVALLGLICSPTECGRTEHLLRDKMRRAYACDVIGVDSEDVFSLVLSRNREQFLRRMILPNVDLQRISPFVETGPAAEAMFFGREDELRAITEHSKDRSFCVVGGRRIGKSSLLIQLHCARLPATGYRALYHDCSTTPTYETFLAAAIRDWRPGPPPDAPLTFGDVLQSPVSTKPLVLLLDEADKLVPSDRANGWRLFSALRALVNSGRAQVVLSGERFLRDALRDPKSPLFNFANEILLGPLRLPRRRRTGHPTDEATRNRIGRRESRRRSYLGLQFGSSQRCAASVPAPH